MARFKHTFARPGRFHIGGGQYRTLTAQEISEYVSGTKAMLADGYEPPVLLEHAEPGTPEGAPRSARDVRAEQVKNGAGWLKDVAVGSDGSAEYELEVTDPAIAEKLRNGSIKFTSPEYRPSWTEGPAREDGQSKTYRNVIGHVALTHKPRNPEQSPLQQLEEPAMQFSLADWEPLQMAAEDDKDADDKTPTDEATDRETPADASENPDLPTPGGESKEAKQLESCIAYLKTIGVAMPSDTDKSNFMDRLQTGLMTLAEAKIQAESEKAKDEEDEDTAPLQEEKPPLQFSMADVEADGFSNRLLAKVIKSEHAGCKGRLEQLVAKNNITPALRDSLLGKADVLQFSAEGEYVPSWTLPEMISLLEKCTYSGQGLTVEQFSVEGDEEKHPGGDAFYDDPNVPVTAERAKQIVDQQAAAGVKGLTPSK